MDKTFGFAIVGSGAIAHAHAKAIALLKGAQLVGVYGSVAQQAAEFAQTYSCKQYETFQKLLEDPQVDIVSICTPSGLHAQYAIDIANAGKHLVTEKPMAITTEQLDAMIQAAQSNGVKAAVIVQKRFSKAVAGVKAAIDGGFLGKIHSADCVMRYHRTESYYAQGGWRGTWAMDGGGALMNQGIHGVDLVQYLMGGVQSVYAYCKTVSRPIETEDHAYILAEYRNGAMGTIHSSTVCAPGQPSTITVCGEKGTVVLQEDTILTWDVEGMEKPSCESGTVASFRNPMDFPIDNHVSQLQDLVDAIREDRTPAVDLYEGRKAVDIILAAYNSSKTGEKILL